MSEMLIKLTNNCGILAEWGKENGLYRHYNEYDPQYGDVVFFDFSGGHTTRQHVGLVEEYDENSGVLTTIEGNTSVTSDDNGGNVMRRTRYLSQVVGYLIPPWSTKQTATRLMAIAKSQIGTKEVPAGSNNVKYNAWYYGHEVSGDDYPWCCVFVCWLFAALAGEISNDGLPDEFFRGIDISWWNKNVDFKAAKRDGIDFAIIRAGYGDGNIDSYAEQNAKSAHAAGVEVGYYWFSYAPTAQMAVAEADYLCDEVERIGVEPTYPLCFDYEYDSEKKAPPIDNIVDIAEAFLQRIEERGYWAANYTNIDYLNRGFSELADRYDTWLAHWDVDTPGRECAIWQYNDKGIVDGVTGVVDLDICYVDYPALISGTTIPADTDESDVPTIKELCMTELPILKIGEYRHPDPAVVSLQRLLIKLGYDCGSWGDDGLFGASTEKAVKEFQRDYGLEEDGIVGPKTWNKVIAG